MKIHVHVRARIDESDLRERVARRLQFGLGRYGTEIRTVRLTIEDVNGPRHGIDKRCTARVTGQQIGDLFLEDVDSVASRALDRLADRLDRTVARALQRARTLGRASPGENRGWAADETRNGDQT